MTLENLLERASKAYYEGSPIMEDWEFDALSSRSQINRVGYKTKGGVKHMHRLYSLQKIFVGEKAPITNTRLIETPKLDGACISLLYKEGYLAQALTRGDGIEGVDITDKIFSSDIVPNQCENIGLEWNPDDTWVQITGEVVAPKSIPNARNYAAGALNLKDNNEFNSRDLTFVVYDVKWESEPEVMGWGYLDDMTMMRIFGFKTVIDSEWDEFPHDGRVFRINSTIEFEKMGYTSHHPRGAYALKQQQETKQTILKDVIWQVGKSGQVSPVAILEPVEIGGAVVRRATLHNIAYIEDLGLEIGCGVEIIRSGEIIPRIVGVVGKNNS